MSPEDFNFIAKLLKDKSGLVVTEDKMYLLESRLNPLARKTNFATIDDLIMSLKTGNQTLTKQVIDAMTTNESFFFRDTKPFDQFKNYVLPYLLKTRADKKSIRIWSAACSSGQEAYSLCMILKEFEAELKGWTIEIVGTDLSTDILNKAKEGLYTQFEVQRGLPIQYLVKFFTKQGDMWQINPEIRNMVQYKELNLLEDFSNMGTFDVIFCRNVLIYFDQEDKSKIFAKLGKSGTNDCFLFLGGAETVMGMTDSFKPITGLRGIYAASAMSQDAIASVMSNQVASTPAPAAAAVFTSAMPSSTQAIPARPVTPTEEKPVFTSAMPSSLSVSSTTNSTVAAAQASPATTPAAAPVAPTQASATPRPAATTVQPTQRPLAGTTATPSTPATGVRPVTTAVRPTTTGIRPATTTGTRPLSSTVRPTTTGVRPSATSAVRPTTGIARPTPTTTRPLAGTTTRPATPITGTRPTTTQPVARPTTTPAAAPVTPAQQPVRPVSAPQTTQPTPTTQPTAAQPSPAQQTTAQPTQAPAQNTTPVQTTNNTEDK